MANIDEIEKVYKLAKNNGAKNITLLYCVSNYPSKASDFSLNNIKILKKKFKCKIGFSDHSTDNRIAMLAISCGAEVVEKHIALENQKIGFDIKFSLKGKEVKKFREDIDLAFKLLQNKKFAREKNEKKLRIYRRSIFAAKKISKGEKFNKNNIRVIRPGHGIDPIYYEKLIGKISPFDIQEAEPIKKNILKVIR